MQTLIRFEPMLNGYLIMDEGEVFLIKERYLKKISTDLINPVIIRPDNYPPSAYSVPIRVQIQTTTLCNLHCITCGIEKTEKKNRPELSVQEIKDLLLKLSQWGVLNIEWSGGEPLMRKNFFEIVRYADDLGLKQSILSNGLAITKKNLADLKKYFFHLQISMDGVNNTYNAIVGKLSWPKFLKSLEIVSSAMASNIVIAIVLQETNVNEIKPIIECCGNLKLPKIRISLQVPIGRSKSISWEKYSHTIDIFRSNWPNLKKYANNKGVEVDCFLEKMQNKDKNVLDMGSIISPGGYSFIYIDAIGDIYPFPFLSSPELRLGSILTDSIKTIWRNSKILAELRSFSYSSFGCGQCRAECAFAERSVVYAFTGELRGRPLPHKECILNLFKK